MDFCKIQEYKKLNPKVNDKTMLETIFKNELKTVL